MAPALLLPEVITMVDKLIADLKAERKRLIEQVDAISAALKVLEGK
jgi:hypothetical protein